MPEPITMTALFTYIAISAGTTAASLVLSRIIPPIFVFAKDKLIEKYRNIFEDHDLVILGGPQSGKSSLILFLTTGKPYLIEGNGEIKEPEPTSGVVFIGKRASKNLNIDRINNRESISKDVGGEFIEKWNQIIQEVNPHGVIYMIDGRRSFEEIESDIDTLFWIIVGNYSGGKKAGKNLRALHIFVNFCDQLSPTLRGDVYEYVTNCFARKMKNPNLRYVDSRIKSLIHLTQLSSKSSSWSEIEKALELFGLHMKSIG
jgi:hypothetical protein